MADYHILSGDRYGNSYTVVMHISIPDSNNAVGVNYRTALAERNGGAVVSAVSGILAAEQTALDNGELVEYSEQFHTHPGLTLTQNRDALDALYSQRVSQVQGRYQNILNYWGFDRDVP